MTQRLPPDPILLKVLIPLSNATLGSKSLTHRLRGAFVIQTTAPLNKNFAEDRPTVIRDWQWGIES